MKYPYSCMQLSQYVGLLNNLSDKFPFHQVYACDKEFRAELEWYPEKTWNVIDQQLWSTTLHGIHTLPHQGNPQQYSFKQRNSAYHGEQTISLRIVLISIEEAATTPLVHSHMCVEGAVPQYTPHSTACKRRCSPNSNNSPQQHQQQWQLEETTYIHKPLSNAGIYENSCNTIQTVNK